MGMNEPRGVLVTKKRVMRAEMLFNLAYGTVDINCNRATNDNGHNAQIIMTVGPLR
jgi:hypothetical protein